MNGIDRNKTDSQIFVKVLIGGDVTAASLEPHFHVELATFADRSDVDVFVEHFDISVSLDHAGGHYARLVGAKIDRLRSVTAQLERNLFQIEDDVGSIFDNSGDRLELVQNAFNFHCGNSCS